MIKTKMMTLKFAIALLSFTMLNTGLSATNAPLTPGDTSFEVKAGVELGCYPSRRSTDVTNAVSTCLFAAADVFNEEEQLVPPEVLYQSLLTIQRARVEAPSFSDQFGLPWTAGAEVGYAVTCNSEVFFEFNYMRAKGKTDRYTVFFPQVVGAIGTSLLVNPVKPAETIEISEKYSDLQSYNGYIGCRYYFPRSCGVSAFLGSKIGVRYWDTVSAHTTFTDSGAVEPDAIVDLGKHGYFDSSTAVSGGLQVGVNYCFSDTCFLTFTAEVVGCCGFHYGKGLSYPNLDIDSGTLSDFNITQVFTAETELGIPVRHVGSVLTFPITLGIKKTF